MAAEYLIKNVDSVIGRLARLNRLMKQMPVEIRCSKEAKRAFVDRMKHFKCYENGSHIIVTKDQKPLTLYRVPIVEQPGIGENRFAVVWDSEIKAMLRRRDHKF